MSEGGAREIAKRLMFGGYSASIGPLRSRWLGATSAQRISVLCYHRVNDELKDNVTLPLERFDRQMAFIRRHFLVVSPSQIVTGDLDRASSVPIVAVTFDDGYLDNYENAYPILRKHGVPAAFFVSTGIIGTNLGFDHDRQKLGHTLPTMTWDQLRDMHSNGFEIGAHTVNHINLAKVGDNEARSELGQSGEAIRREIGCRDVMFAYCFGRRTDITPERRNMVRQSGFTCCFAAYGGTNVGPIDVFDIKRFGVNWAFSESAFRARIEGLM